MRDTCGGRPAQAKASQRKGTRVLLGGRESICGQGRERAGEPTDKTCVLSVTGGGLECALLILENSRHPFEVEV